MVGQQALGQRRVVRGLCEGFPQPGVLHLQAQVFARQAFVDLSQRRIAFDAGVEVLHAGGHLVGRRQPDAALIVVEAEEQDEAHRFEHQEEQQITVLAEKVEKVKHGSGCRWGMDGENKPPAAYY